MKLNQLKFKKIQISKKYQRVALISTIFLFSVLIGLLGLNYYYLNRIFPQVYIAGVNISGKTLAQATSHLQNNIKPPENITLYSDQDGRNFSTTISLDSLNFSYDYEASATKALMLHRSGNLTKDITSVFLTAISPEVLPLTTTVDRQALLENLSIIAGQLSTEVVYPSAKMVGDQIIVNAGSPGSDIDQEAIAEQLINNLSHGVYSAYRIDVEIIDPRISESEKTSFEIRAKKMYPKTLRLTFEKMEFDYSQNEILALLAANGLYNNQQIEKIISQIDGPINREAQNPVFIFKDGRVVEFAAARLGVKIDPQQTETIITNQLRQLENDDAQIASAEIAIISTLPDYKTEDVNNMGINELIGSGSSKFVGSDSSRMHNIAHSSEKINGTLIKPGGAFSFNDTIGDVSVLTGYKQAYIIKDGKTMLGDGGGVCQVSTTVFRAALNSGLAITQRSPHSYRVGYYEQDGGPGLDATVYLPTPDLKFENDTAHHILIQTIMDAKAATLIVEIYGTSDGRDSILSKPVITSVIPPPEDLYIDDPTLPAGTVKQIEKKAWGAKVSFTYKVQRGDEVLQDQVFYSNYRPWQAKFLRGTGSI